MNNTFTVTVVNKATYAAGEGATMGNMTVLPAGTADKGPGKLTDGPLEYEDAADITVDAYDGDAYDIDIGFIDVEVTTATIKGVVLQPGAQVTITVDFAAGTATAQVVYQDGSKQEYTSQSYHSTGPDSPPRGQ